ncbi:MAG: cob(I)yrinic acid a,c-diamide adenosyltransferase [Candidatus Aenigmarchaeota archaeon]|nr:cob(I)yrinic acid a,c-diamide adenosyltransferase [Candidatus Aenigmarchaeota archaeon]
MSGKVLVYTGDGEGKTTAALGHAIRFAGYGNKVAIIHFMKGRKTGEYRFLEPSSLVDVFLYGPPYFLSTTQSVLSGWIEGNPDVQFVTSANIAPSAGAKKGGRKNGKKVAADKLASDLKSCSFDAHLKKAKKGLEFALKVMEEKKYKLVVLDEILYAIKFKLLKESDVVSLLSKRNGTNVILTGRGASERIIQLADLVTNLGEEKHYFSTEKKALIGLDF